MSASYTILPGSLQLDRGYASIGPRATEKQRLLHYTVQEANGAEFKVSVLWNKLNCKTLKVDYPGRAYGISSKKPEIVQKLISQQATLREKVAHGIKLTPAELKQIRYAHIPPRSRVCTKQPASPKPAPAPVITPAAIAATLAAQQTQITKLTTDLAEVKVLLQRTTADKDRLIQLLAATQAQLDKVTAAFNAILIQK